MEGVASKRPSVEEMEAGLAGAGLVAEVVGWAVEEGVEEAAGVAAVDFKKER